jgi:hypothetical protein
MKIIGFRIFKLFRKIRRMSIEYQGKYKKRKGKGKGHPITGHEGPDRGADI